MMRVIEDSAMFIAYCVEIYKAEKQISGQEAYNFLSKTGAVDFLTECYEGLHTTSSSYIIESIEEFVMREEYDKVYYA